MENAVVTKSFQFAVRIVKLCRYLQTEKKEYTLSDQLLRSGTSIGANVEEAQQGTSRADFTFKLTIALKEASESDYWLRLLRASDYLTEEEFSSVYADCKELERLLTSIVKSARSKSEA
ncbi:MAG: four helix bundle protein [Clostridia bacterium]|nr:four helix bundle protein [Clostridia bacterium]